MTDHRSITADLRANIDARREMHPLEFRMLSLEKKLPEIERGLKGNNWQANLCVAECREATADVKAMGDTITSQNEMIAEMKAAIGALQADVLANAERIEAMAQWAKTKT